MLKYIFKHKRLLILFISIIFFSLVYLLLDDNNFSGVNYVKEKVKEEVLKKKVEKNIEKETNKEGYTILNNVEKSIDKTVKEAKEEIEETDLIDESVNVSMGQKLFNRIYFSISTGTLLGYGDIYPTSNICKLIVMIQTLITVSLIVFR